MFKQGEQLTFNFFDEPIKKTVERVDYIPTFQIISNNVIIFKIGKFETTVRIDKIKRLIWSSSNENAYIHKNDGILTLELTYDDLKNISDKYDLELLECFKYKEIASICVFEEGSEKHLKEINEKDKSKEKPYILHGQ